MTRTVAPLTGSFVPLTVTVPSIFPRTGARGLSSVLPWDGDAAGGSASAAGTDGMKDGSKTMAAAARSSAAPGDTWRGRPPSRTASIRPLRTP